MGEWRIFLTFLYLLQAYLPTNITWDMVYMCIDSKEMYLWICYAPGLKGPPGHVVFASSIRPSICLFIHLSICCLSEIPSRLHIKCNIYSLGGHTIFLCPLPWNGQGIYCCYTFPLFRPTRFSHLSHLCHTWTFQLKFWTRICHDDTQV